MFLYTFPGFLGIPPHRHLKVSKVEQSFDIIMMVLWIGACSQLASYGKCPKQVIALYTYVDISDINCPTLWVIVILGYLNAILYAWKFRDAAVAAKDAESETEGKHIMFARGSWRDRIE